jgi:hypothetical protein
MEKQRKHILVIVRHKATDNTIRNKKTFAWEIAEDIIRNLNGSLYKRKFSNKSIRELNNLFDNFIPLIMDYIEIKLSQNSLYKQNKNIYKRKLKYIIYG